MQGFSKRTKTAKLEWLVQHYFHNDAQAARIFCDMAHKDPELQKIIDGFSENTVSNFLLPYGVAPNFLINGVTYCVPMVIEESSVVAAASSAAKFWQTRGGFHVEIVGTEKIGQLHFSWSGDVTVLKALLPELAKTILHETEPLTANMQRRGGGITGIELEDFSDREPDYFQLKLRFETCDSMGANFINSVLEESGRVLTRFLKQKVGIEPTIIMAILSNYTPNCLAKAWVECPVESFGTGGSELAEKFRKAIRIAEIDSFRAVTHNKGIFNGIDAVVLATGNDFRATEACGHAYAARTGMYKSLSRCEIKDNLFRFELEIPLAFGTVGGLTTLHPLAKLSLAMLGNPSAKTLMMVVAATGLAQNFAAVRSLVTTGIQKGHMKMHLTNILNHLQATEPEMQAAVQHFVDKPVSFSGVRTFLKK
jgi:hydroxymethylglutaryl-CoA reductase